MRATNQVRRSAPSTECQRSWIVVLGDKCARVAVNYSTDIATAAIANSPATTQAIKCLSIMVQVLFVNENNKDKLILSTLITS